MSKWVIKDIGIDSAINIREAAKEALTIVDRRIEGIPYFFKTRWNVLNDVMGGGIPFNTTVTVGARTSVGKSTFTNIIAFDIFKLNEDIPILLLYWNWEMPSYQQVLRKFSNDSRKSVKDLLSINKILDEETRCSLEELKEEYKDLNIFFMDKSTTIEKIYSTIKSLSIKFKEYRIVNIFDHTRLITKTNERTEEEKITNLLHYCNKVNKEFNCTNIVLSQLNRKIEDEFNEKKIYRKPGNSDLFGADSVAQYSNIILLLHRPEMYGINIYERDSPGVFANITRIAENCANKLYIEVTKNRDGDLKTIVLNHKIKENSIYE